MGRDKGRSLPEVRRRNRVCIKEQIYRKAPVTRTEVAEELGLTLPTITTSVAQMLEDGLLLEEPMPESEFHTGQSGRRPLLLRFNPDAGYAVGVELGPYETSIVLTNLAGESIYQKIFPQASDAYDAMLETLWTQLQPVLRQVPQEKLLGIGIGAPGFVNQEAGVIRASFRNSWNGQNMADDLQKRASLPVLVDNNVRMRALGQELLHGDGLPDLFAYFFISKGIACPLMINHSILSGSTSGAGEIGHMVIQPDGALCPSCGQRGCLEALAGETAIQKECAMLLRFNRAPILRAMCRENLEPDMKIILRAQQAGDEDVRKTMERAVDYLGQALANVVNLISPAQVLVDGYIMQLEENRNRLLSITRRHFYGLNAQEVQIRFLPFDHFSGALGAAAAVINRFCIQK